MREALTAKFTHREDLGTLLLSTGTPGSSSTPSATTSGLRVRLQHLGRLLMEVRDALWYSLRIHRRR